MNTLFLCVIREAKSILYSLKVLLNPVRNSLVLDVLKRPTSLFRNKGGENKRQVFLSNGITAVGFVVYKNSRSTCKESQVHSSLLPVDNPGWTAIIASSL